MTYIDFTPEQQTLEKIHTIVTLRETLENGKPMIWKKIAEKVGHSRTWVQDLYRWYKENKNKLDEQW